ncbi:MAG: GatB/YqeY domain-containing protein [Bryobacteraceae bacterium]|nr:GatB/YqeY domain-containing protein [Bryobacteraceae bacterium]
MSMLDRLQKDMVAAMKAKEEDRLSALRMMKAALMKAKVDNPGKPLDDAAEMAVMSSLIKQRKESADMFRKGGREEQALKEEAEAKLIESYLPASASEEEMAAAIDAAVAETGAASSKQMGLVMNAVKARLAGKRVDGKLLADKVKARLG